MARYTGTIAVVPNDIPFAGTANIEFTCSHPKPWAHVVIMAPDGGQVLQVAYPRLWNGEGTFQCGPTPSWPSGPGVGTCDLTYWNGRRFVRIASTTFTVNS
jgi:hypothetical protein